MRDVPEVQSLLTATAVGIELGLSRQTINKQIKAGRFKSLMRMDPVYVIRRSEIEAIKAGKHESYKVPEDGL